MKKTGLYFLIAYTVLSCTNEIPKPSFSSKDKFTVKEFVDLMDKSHLQLQAEYVGNNSIMHRFTVKEKEEYNKYYFYHKNESDFYYRINKTDTLRQGQMWSGIYLESCGAVGEVTDSNKWIEINTEFNRVYNYEPSIPSEYDTTKKLDEGIYKWNGKELEYIGSLTDYCKLKEFEAGLYVLTPPGIFYTRKFDLDSIKVE